MKVWKQEIVDKLVRQTGITSTICFDWFMRYLGYHRISKKDRREIAAAFAKRCPDFEVCNKGFERYSLKYPGLTFVRRDLMAENGGTKT